MKYAILLLLAIISMASMLTFRSRNRVHVHEIDCPEAQALDDKYVKADDVCSVRTNNRSRILGIRWDDEYFSQCLADELGIESMSQFDAMFKEAEEICAARARR